MQINLADEIFSSVPAYKILSAIQTAIEQHHQLIIDTSGINYVSWLDSCDRQIDSETSFWMSYAQSNSIFVESKRFVQVVSKPQLFNQVTFDELVTIMLRSFHIYVENGRADKRFLYAMLTPELRRDLKDQEKIGAIIFENAGGITELAKKIVDDNNVRARLPLRAFALFDSDALEPNLPSPDALEAQRVCKAVNIPHYCLSRRAIENYIPENSLLTYASMGKSEHLKTHRKKIARAFARLNDRQKSHFHMKEGLKAPHGAHYSEVNDNDRATLGSGFGSHLSECYDEGGIVDRRSLENSSGWNELESLITAVMEVL